MAASQTTVNVLKGGDAEVQELTAAGDIEAAGGFRKNFGPFVRDNVAASLTNAACFVGVSGAGQTELVATRAGSLVGISASLSVAPAGASLTVSVFKNGALMHATAILTIPAGAPLGYYVVFAKDTANLTVAAGDRLTAVVTTPAGWTAITSDIAILLEIEG